MSDEEPLKIERRGSIALLTINRAERMNSLSRATLHAFVGAKRILDESDIRAIVLTGAGDKAFCAGADLKERKGMAENDVRAQVKLYREAFGWLDDAPVPVIAAINGVALGGGLELALVCDLRVAAPNAILGLPEVTIGIIPGAGGTQRLPRLVGEARAKELILFGTRLTAERALGLGILNRVTESGKNVVDDTLEWIEPLSRGAPIAQRSALGAIDDSFRVPLEAGLELERLHYDECLTSEDRVEALAAFAEKRKPVFRGR